MTEQEKSDAVDAFALEFAPCISALPDETFEEVMTMLQHVYTYAYELGVQHQREGRVATKTEFHVQTKRV